MLGLLDDRGEKAKRVELRGVDLVGRRGDTNRTFVGNARLSVQVDGRMFVVDGI